MELKKGPSIEIIFRCVGCSNLRTENWKLDNCHEVTESGTRAICDRANKLISSTYQKYDVSPKWCPYKLNTFKLSFENFD